MPQPLLDFGGSGPLIHILPANGFPIETYLPLFRPLLDAYRLISLPPRALWGDESPPETLHDWRELKDDLLAGMRQHNVTEVIAAGHSFGGVASLLAAIEEPQRFKALILLDPTIMPVPVNEMIRALQEQGKAEDILLVPAARRRQNHFESREAAFERFRERSLFKDWPDESLRLYVEHGLIPDSRGNGLKLTWSPDWEAYYYKTMYTHTWEDVPKLKDLLPVLFIRGGASDTFVEAAEKRIRELIPQADYAVVEGHGHLFPQSAPDATRVMIRDWLRRVFG